MKTETHVILDLVMASEWHAKFVAGEPVLFNGKKYLIETASSAYAPNFQGMTCTLIPYIEVTAATDAEGNHHVDFAAMPEGTTHVCIKSSSLWRKAANGVAFAWVNATWQQIGALAETWQPIVEATALRDMEKQYVLGKPLKARWVLKNSARLTARRWFEGAALFVPGDYLACNWPRSVYNGAGLNFPCTRVPVEPAQWDGEGLPPVGVDCEALRLGQWIKCRIFAHRYGRALFDFEGGWGDCDELARFRPIKTAEQLAAEQREAEIERLEAVFIRFCTARYAASPTGGYTHRMVAEAFHSEGVRFPEEKC